MPTPNARHHHWEPFLDQWLHTFDFPTISPNGTDSLLWDGSNASKIKTWDIWNFVRSRSSVVSWNQAVWHRLRINRYAHHKWL